MNRPYIICHMVTSIDGKVTGEFLYKSECQNATKTYYEINRKLKCDGFICGRVTMEESFTNCYYPDLTMFENKPIGIDYISKSMSGFYAVSFDRKGKLGWTSNFIIDNDPGYARAQIIEVITEEVDSRYLGYLQKMDISYIFADKIEVALEKLYNLGIKTLLLEGGSIINGAFLKAGVIDEISLVVAPLTANKDDKSIFMDGLVEKYKLISVEERNNSVWLRYKSVD